MKVVPAARLRTLVPSGFRKIAHKTILKLSLALSHHSGQVFEPGLIRPYGARDEELFGSYFDVNLFSEDETAFVANSWKRSSGDFNVVVRSVESGEDIFVASTKAWNWQQGAMATWIDGTSFIAFNRLSSGGSRVRTWLAQPSTGELQEMPYSAAEFSRSGDLVTTSDYPRLTLLSPQYGYQGLFRCRRDVAHDLEVWNVRTGKRIRNLSLERMVEARGQRLLTSGDYFIHPKLSPNAIYVVFLLRRCLSRYRDFTSALLLWRLSDDTLQVLNSSGYVSHYSWRSDNELWCYCRLSSDGIPELVRYRLDDGNVAPVSPCGEGARDTHPAFSRDGRFLLMDSYPDRARQQFLWLYDTCESRTSLLARVYSPLAFDSESRCDLHPRWSLSGRYFVFDSSRSGRRRVYIGDTQLALEDGNCHVIN